MVYQLIFKKRFKNKLEKLLIYLEGEFGLLITQKFAKKLEKQFELLQKHPFIGRQSPTIPNIRSIPAGRYNRMYYRVEKDKIIIVNMYDTRINPKRNRIK
jgi:plasmid stabilization system protein ParE